MKDKELRKLIGSRAKQRRTELNLTQPYIAEKMGVTASTIQRYEAGTIDNTKKMVLEGLSGKIIFQIFNLVGPYELHDFFLYYMLRWTFPPKKIFRLAQNAFAGEYDDETILKWLKTFYRRFFMQQFKRSCLPDGPKVGSVAVSPRGDLRMPSDASAALWMKELEQIRI